MKRKHIATLLLAGMALLVTLVAPAARAEPPAPTPTPQAALPDGYGGQIFLIAYGQGGTQLIRVRSLSDLQGVQVAGYVPFSQEAIEDMSVDWDVAQDIYTDFVAPGMQVWLAYAADAAGDSNLLLKYGDEILNADALDVIDTIISIAGDQMAAQSDFENEDYLGMMEHYISQVTSFNSMGMGLMLGTVLGDGPGAVAGFVCDLVFEQFLDLFIKNLMYSYYYKHLSQSALDEGISIAKPNIYLYPERTERLRVTLEPHERITASDPLYENGWDVRVEPDGRIDQRYDHLFYEAKVESGWNLERGWVVPRSDLESFIGWMLDEFGLNEREKRDFLEYWMPRISWDQPYVLVAPQDQARVDRSMELAISPQPDSVLRLWVYLKPVSEHFSVEPYRIERFERKGFTVVEWGVFR